jgi:predicted enzyme related to lactoylglutathione lyase
LFYSELCGWKFSAANGLGYRSLKGKSGAGIDGGIWPAPPNSPEIVQLYLEVPDIDHALSQIRALGGSVLMTKQVLPDGDAMALATDPLGRSFGLMMRK